MIVSSGRPSPPWRRVSSEPSIVPTVRLTLLIGDVRCDRLAPLERRRALLDERAVERLVEPVVLADDLVEVGALGQRRAVQDRREVEAGGLPVVDRVGHVEHLDVADRLGQACGSRARPAARGPRWRGTRRT